MNALCPTANRAVGGSWSYWEFGAGFGIYDRENRRWRTELLNALIPNDTMDLKP